MTNTAGQTEPQPLALFCSYHQSDEELCRELEKHLRPLQRQGLIRNWYQYDISAGDERQNEVNKHLNEAQIILLLISADFLASDYYYSTEMQRALERQESGEAQVIPVILRPVSYEDAPFTKLQILPKDGIPIVSNQWQNHDEAWVHVVNELRKVIAKLSATLPISQPLPAKQIWHVPYRRNPFFTGREELLTRLHDWFTQESTGNTIALTQSLAIHGLGGIGKTQTALEYAYRYRHEYQTVLWVAAMNEEALLTDFLKIASLLSIPQIQDPQQTLSAVKTWLASHSRWLLILDNADNLPMANAYLPEGDIQGHILFTTRAEVGGNIAQMLPVEVMDAQEGALLLLRRARVLSPGTLLEQAREKAQAEAEAIVEAVGRLPLAIDQAGAYIEETGCGLASYLDLYRTRRKELLQRRSTLPSSHPEPVATTWSLSFRLIEQANPAAAELLRACAFLDPDAIPEDLFFQGGKYLGSILASIVEDPYAFNQAIEELRKFSLIRRNAETRTLSIHRLVQAVLRDALKQQEEQNWAELIIQAVNWVYPNGTFENWERCRMLLPHALTCTTLIETYQIHSEEARVLLNNVGWYLREQGLYVQAEPLLLQALVIREQQEGLDDLVMGVTLDNLALLYRAQGKYTQAESLLLRSLAISEEQEGIEHPNTAATLDNLALLYVFQGKHTQAEPLFLQALAIYEKRRGSEHPETGITLNNFALLYQDQGKLAQAESLFLRALAIYEKQGRVEHPETAATLDNLAQLYQDQGKLAQAESFFLRALAIREQQLGSEHPDTAITLNNLALFYQGQGKYTQAEPLFLRSLAIAEQQLGSEHPDTSTTLNNLAQLYQDQGKLAQAESFFLRALAIREQQLGPEHPGAAVTLYNLARLYQLQEKNEQAEQLYQRVLAIDEQVYGPDHSKVATDLEAYADLLLVMHRDEEAAPLLNRAKHIHALNPSSNATTDETEV